MSDIVFLNLEIIPIAFGKGGEPFRKVQEDLQNAIEKGRTHQTLRKIAQTGLNDLTKHQDPKISARARTLIEDYRL